jgi:hypothetical protein
MTIATTIDIIDFHNHHIPARFELTAVKTAPASQRMRPPRLSMLVAGTGALFSAPHTVAETMCRPTLTFEQVRLAETRGQRRQWSAVVAVDASSCATTSGRFYINFVRLKEMAPDVLFSEEFAWNPGRIEISVEFWLDEAVGDYWIGHVPMCPCRN